MQQAAWGCGGEKAKQRDPDGGSDRMNPPPPRVLGVADGDARLSVTRDALGHAGFETETAQMATEAVRRLTARRYAVIVADCSLPDLPPLDWLAAIRGAAPTTPLVVYAELSRLEELRGHAADFCAAAVLEPPVSPAQLVEAVRAALGHAE